MLFLRLLIQDSCYMSHIVRIDRNYGISYKHAVHESLDDDRGDYTKILNPTSSCKESRFKRFIL